MAERFLAIEGPAYRYQWGEDERDVSYQVDGTDGPGIQFEWRLDPEHVGWYAYTHPEAEDAEDGPLTESEALDWLWHNPPGKLVDDIDVLEAQR